MSMLHCAMQKVLSTFVKLLRMFIRGAEKSKLDGCLLPTRVTINAIPSSLITMMSVVRELFLFCLFFFSQVFHVAAFIISLPRLQ